MGDPRHPGEPPSWEDADETVVEGRRVEVDDQGGYREDRYVERRPEPRRPQFWPWLLLLLGLVLGGIAAAWYFTQEDTKTVPNVVGQRLDAAVNQLQAEGFRTDISEQSSNEEEAGVVFDTEPPGGAEADEGATVQVLVSTGPEQVDVPDVVGDTEDDAREALDEAGLESNVVEVFSEQPEGVVVAQSPATGRADVGSTVRINVSKGTGRATVPDLVGETAQSATQQLEQLDLEANVVQVPSAEPEGSVVAQNPVGGTTVQVGSTVRLNVSDGP